MVRPCETIYGLYLFGLTTRRAVPFLIPEDPRCDHEMERDCLFRAPLLPLGFMPIAELCCQSFQRLEDYSNFLRSDDLASLIAALDRDGLQFEMSAPQERSGADEFPRRQVLGREVALVNRIEFFEKRQVRACNLDVHQVVHGHPGLRQHRLLPVQQVLDLVLNLLRRFSRLRIQAEPPRQIECVSRQDRVAERQLCGLIRKVDRLLGGLYRNLRKRATYGKNSTYRQNYREETDATIHTLPPFE